MQTILTGLCDSGSNGHAQAKQYAEAFIFTLRDLLWWFVEASGKQIENIPTELVLGFTGKLKASDTSKIEKAIGAFYKDFKKDVSSLESGILHKIGFSAYRPLIQNYLKLLYATVDPSTEQFDKFVLKLIHSGLRNGLETEKSTLEVGWDSQLRTLADNKCKHLNAEHLVRCNNGDFKHIQSLAWSFLEQQNMEILSQWYEAYLSYIMSKITTTFKSSDGALVPETNLINKIKSNENQASALKYIRDGIRKKAVPELLETIRKVSEEKDEKVLDAKGGEENETTRAARKSKEEDKKVLYKVDLSAANRSHNSDGESKTAGRWSSDEHREAYRIVFWHELASPSSDEYRKKYAQKILDTYAAGLRQVVHDLLLQISTYHEALQIPEQGQNNGHPRPLEHYPEKIKTLVTDFVKRVVRENPSPKKEEHVMQPLTGEGHVMQPFIGEEQNLDEAAAKLLLRREKAMHSLIHNEQSSIKLAVTDSAEQAVIKFSTTKVLKKEHHLSDISYLQLMYRQANGFENEIKLKSHLRRIKFEAVYNMYAYGRTESLRGSVGPSKDASFIGFRALCISCLHPFSKNKSSILPKALSPRNDHEIANLMQPVPHRREDYASEAAIPASERQSTSQQSGSGERYSGSQSGEEDEEQDDFSGDDPYPYKDPEPKKGPTSKWWV